MLFDILYDACPPEQCAAARVKLLQQAKQIFDYPANQTAKSHEGLAKRNNETLLNIDIRPASHAALPIQQPFALESPEDVSKPLSPTNLDFLSSVGLMPKHTFGPISISSDSEDNFMPTPAVPSSSKEQSTQSTLNTLKQDLYDKPSVVRGEDRPLRAGRKRHSDSAQESSKRRKTTRLDDVPSRQRPESRSKREKHQMPLTWDWRYLLFIIDCARSCQAPANRDWPAIPQWLLPADHLATLPRRPSVMPDLKFSQRQSFRAEDDDSSYAVDALKFLYKDSRLDRNDLACFYRLAKRDETARFKTFTQIARLKRDVFGSDGVCEKLVRMLEKMPPAQVASITHLSQDKIDRLRKLARHADDHPRYFESGSALISHQPMPVNWDARVYLAIAEYVQSFNLPIDGKISPAFRQLSTRPRLEFDIDRTHLPPISSYPRALAQNTSKPAALSAFGFMYDTHSLSVNDLEAFRQHAPAYLNDLLNDLADIAKLRFIVTRLNGGLLPQLRDALQAQPHLCTQQNLNLVNRLADQVKDGRVAVVQQR